MTTSHSNCRATLFSPRPLSELLVPRLAHAASEAQLGYKTITLEFPGQRGPSELVVHYTGHDGVRGLLRHLPEIERLKIEQGAAEVLSEDGWDDLRYVPNLEEFEAPLWHKPRTTLDAAAIRWLGEMKNLRNMTGALSAGLAPTDLQPLGQLKQLEELNLSCGLVTAEHLRFVAQLESLRKLSLTVRFHGFDDEHGLRYLSLLPRLDDLYLHQISDVGMTYLSNVKSVSRLSIDGPGVTVAGLKHLGELPNLKYLDIRWTGVTDEQLKAFADRHRSIIVRSDRGSQKRL